MNSSPKPSLKTTPGATGGRAESVAAAYLTREGLTIVGRNFRTRYGEIDLIARDGRTLVFVEVRMRRSMRYGGALESINAAKRARMLAAAKGYLALLGREPVCRFDVVVMQGVDGDDMTWHRDVLAVDD